MTFKINISTHQSIDWNVTVLREKLTQLGQASKDKVWIHSDLTCSSSTLFSRIFWAVARHFDWMRKYFYKIDLERSKIILKQIWTQLNPAAHQDLIPLFHKAVIQFNTIAPKHQVILPKVRPDFKPLRTAQRAKPSTLLSSFAARLNTGADANTLLEEAVNLEEPGLAAWLIEKGASLNQLPPGLGNQKLLDWLHTISKKIAPTPANLNHFALTLGYGYKSANLLILQAHAAEISNGLRSSRAEVPPFLPIADIEVSTYIRRHLPDLFALWEEFKNSFDPARKATFLSASSDAAAAKTGLTLGSSSKALLNTLSNQMIDHFTRARFSTLQLQEWMARIQPAFLIVRSTGKEDSDTHSNAGGNLSIPYAAPQPDALSEAIGRVIASYFGAASISQRLFCGDRTVFTDPHPFMPILIQEAIGEPTGKTLDDFMEIPRSGVLFTRQQGKAEGVALIQTGLGHNEGIVSAKVPVDSYYVKEGTVHTVIRKKEIRLANQSGKDGRIDLVTLQNSSKALECAPALPKSLILDLKRTADYLAATYADPEGAPKALDVEYTVKLKQNGSFEPVIYLLQTRPLISGSMHSPHDYSHLDLKRLKRIENDRILKAGILLDGNAYVRIITDPQALLIAETLPEALLSYSQSPHQYSAILIHHSAPATSHAAVVLNPLGIPVFIMGDQDLQRWMAQVSPETPLLLDSQRGWIVLCPKEHPPETFIQKGLVSYPIPLEFSVPDSTWMQSFSNCSSDKAKEKIVKEFNQWSSALIVSLHSGPIQHKEFEIYELFDLMATGNTKQAKQALASLLYLMQSKLAHSLKQAQDATAPSYRPMFQVLEAAFRLAQFEIAPALEMHPPQSLERLYPIKFLQALLYQRHHPEIVAGYSYLQILGEEKERIGFAAHHAEQGIIIQGPKSATIIELSRLSSLCYSEENAALWQNFLKSVAALSAEKQAAFLSKFTPIILKLSEIDLLPIWINLQFKNTWGSLNTNQNAASLHSWLLQCQIAFRDIQGTYDWIHTRKLVLKSQEERIPCWEDPRFCSEEIQNLLNTFSSDLGFEGSEPGAIGICSQWKKCNQPLSRLALLQYIRKAVDIYDRSIKAVKGSKTYANDREKALQTARMLKGYLKMLQTLFALVPVSEQHRLQKIDFNTSTPVLFNDYLNKLQKGCTYKFGFTTNHRSDGLEALSEKIENGTLDASPQLKARDCFAVNALVVGSHADLNFSVHWPNTLEEYFTTIHQNMEQIVKILSTKNGINRELLSNTAKTWCDRILSAFGQEISHLDIEENTLKIVYQIPLRQHSGTIVLSYEPRFPKKDLLFTIRMFGNEEHNRWAKSAACGALLGYAMGPGCTLRTAPSMDYSAPFGVEFTLQISPSFAPKHRLLATIQYVMKELTMKDSGNANKVIDLLETNNYFGDIRWEEIDPECFSHTLFLNAALIAKFSTLQGPTLQSGRVALQSLKGIAKRKLANYIVEKKCLRELAYEHLKYTMGSIPEFAKEVQALVAIPEVSKMFEAECKGLRSHLIQISQPGYALHLAHASFRKQCLAQLNENVAILQNLVDSFDAEYCRIFSLCADTLIGLSQLSDYQTKSFGLFRGLENHLGKPKYDYVFENDYTDTTKLRKAAPLYLIKGLESPNPDIREAAISAFKRLIEDYREFRSDIKDAAAANHVIFAVARAYLDNATTPGDGAKELYHLFKNDSKMMEQLLNSGKIPNGPKQSALLTYLKSSETIEY